MDDEKARGLRLLLLGKGAVLRTASNHRLTAEMDESEQRPTRGARTCWLLLSTGAGVPARTQLTPARDDPRSRRPCAHPCFLRAKRASQRRHRRRSRLVGSRRLSHPCGDARLSKERRHLAPSGVGRCSCSSNRVRAVRSSSLATGCWFRWDLQRLEPLVQREHGGDGDLGNAHRPSVARSVMPRRRIAERPG
jgi:hypothetical protein